MSERRIELSAFAEEKKKKKAVKGGKEYAIEVVGALQSERTVIFGGTLK